MNVTQKLSFDVFKVMAALHAATRFSGTVDKKSLVGDTRLQAITRRLQQTVGTPLQRADGGPSTLAEVGFASQRDGSLALERSKLESAFTRDFAGPASLFVQDLRAGTHGVAARVQEMAGNFTSPADGSLTVRNRAYNSQLASMERRKAVLEQRLEKYEQGLKTKFSDYERLMSKLHGQGNLAVSSSLKTNRNE